MVVSNCVLELFYILICYNFRQEMRSFYSDGKLHAVILVESFEIVRISLASIELEMIAQ